ncbi:cupin domain-containing protein [Chroococcidiopsis sp. TS-821]|uniref:cupin domain-containing protein n=1 Tax=Chroococcidiopsis sp. TS-821 TaxID=1378066 RepID=UPI000CEF41C3|nr:cupin domain-containing protein [Chroococcidiopsis sp. TS-821]PPS43236.1 cupin [Chroococcidiopsis sp. TS-821]
MSSTIDTTTSAKIQLREQIEYPNAGVLSKVLLKDNACQYTLFCLAANTEIAEHTSTYNATINVIEGKGILNFEGQEIALQPGVFIFMRAHAPHALKATENLAFLLTLSEKIVQSN